MSNFIDLFDSDKVLSLHLLVEPLKTIILQNLEKEECNTRKYLNMADFSFLWFLACKQRINRDSAIAICEIMQIYMLKRDP